MALIFDYLDSRGDLSFDAAPVNEADLYVISKIGCPDLTGLVPSDEREIPLPEAVAAFRAQAGDKEVSLGISSSPNVLESFYRLPSVPRFQPLMLSGFRRKDDLDSAEQFSALTIRIPGGPRFITFRGTDDNIFAWKENFRMAVMDAIPAQTDALRYLEWAMNAYEGDFVVCGHSKGGNLAVYAASMLPPALQDRIVSVYNFDGPGFQEAFLKEAGYLRILPKQRFLVPQNSIVGLLLSTGAEPEVVSCGCYGVRAHDGFTWDLLDTDFLRAEALSPSSIAFKKAMDETLAGMSPQDMEVFIEDFFQIMTSAGALTLTDLTETRLVGALEIVRSLDRDTEVHKFAYSLLSNTLADIRSRRERRHILPGLRREEQKQETESAGTATAG